jgi:hypothetical protein
MAVAVAQALQNREHLAVEAGTEEEGGHLDAHDQSPGATHGKRPADAGGCARRVARAGEV